MNLKQSKFYMSLTLGGLRLAEWCVITHSPLAEQNSLFGFTNISCRNLGKFDLEANNKFI
jgi:hypothetical protein